MKTIQPVSIWDNGQVLEATILNAYSTFLLLGTSATFYYELRNVKEDGTLSMPLTQGNLTMTGEAYAQWEVDSYAWDWVAEQLNLTITGDYIPPIVEAPIIEEAVEEVPVASPIIAETKTSK
jgi:hypothetical protein